jgi:hypothetical protein
MISDMSYIRNYISQKDILEKYFEQIEKSDESLFLVLIHSEIISDF